LKQSGILLFNYFYYSLNIIGSALFNNRTKKYTIMKNEAKVLMLIIPAQIIRASLVATIMILFTSMAISQSTVVDVVVNSEDHNTLEAAVIAAELADDLSGEGPFTVFAPTDAAFKALPDGTVEALLKDPTGDLASILMYHVVGAKAMSGDLSDGQSISTLNGDKIDVKIKEGKVFIDAAQVTVADIKTDNGVVHVIDAVILPSNEMAKASASKSGGGCN
jgi:uncharacterized surface protein with fasciclin (FAS1) repeats